MPTARSYGPLKVSTTPVPGVRLQAAETPESRGAGLFAAQARGAEELAGLGNTVANLGATAWNRIQTEERQHADDLALLEAENTLATWTQGRLYDPDKGALNVHGKEAMPLPEVVNGEFEQLSDAVGAQMVTPKQQFEFARMRAQHSLRLDLALRRHVSDEMQKWEASELDKGVQNGIDAAIANALEPNAVGEQLDQVVGKIQRHGPRAGMSPEAVTAAVAEARSTVHVGVVERLLANGFDKQADIYFQETKGEISGRVLGRVERALEEGTRLAEAQRQTDAILAAGGTLAEQRAKAKAIDDPKVRQEVLQQLEHEDTVNARAERDADEDRLRTAYDVVDKFRSVSKIPATVWAELDGNDRSALRHYAKLLVDVGTGAVKSDMGELYKLLTLSSTNPDAFLRENILRYKGKLSNPDLEQMMRMQASMRTGGTKADANLFASEAVQGQIVDEQLKILGLTGTPTELAKKPELNNRIIAFRRAVREAVGAQEARTGKKATDKEVQSIVDVMSTPTGLKDGGWFGRDQPFFAFETAQAQVSAITQVPAAERRQIERVLAGRGIPVSDARIIALYNERLARVRGDR